jgi:hypothetical protein
MLFQSRFHDAIRRGELTSTIRIWHQPRVRVGGRYSLGRGSIQVERMQEIEFDALTPALARRAGFASVVELLKVAKHGAGERIFLIDFRYVDTLKNKGSGRKQTVARKPAQGSVRKAGKR